MKTKQRTKRQTFALMHKYYKYTGFYSFILQGVKKAILPTLVVVAILIYVNYKVINITEALTFMTQNLNDFTIFSIFLISESILGLIPPDIFIAWSKVTPNPILYLSILAVLSYLGGVIAYFMGKAIAAIPSVNKYMYTKMEKHIINMQKWGGFLIIVGALLPLPFAIACLAAGMINYSRRQFFLVGLFRFLRFVIYGLVIYSAI